MKQFLPTVTFLCITLFVFVRHTEGHGWLSWPWPRTVFGVTDNCGYRYPLINGTRQNVLGMWQTVDPGTACGVCGDDYLDPAPRAMEMGNFTIIDRAVFQQSTNVTVIASISSPHCGSVSVRVCCNATLEMDPNTTVAQSCFNANKQYIIGVQTNVGAEDYVRLNNGQVDIVICERPNNTDLILNMTMNFEADILEDQHCTIQWNYMTLGRGGETFRMCSDVYALRDDSTAKFPILQRTYLKNKEFDAMALAQDVSSNNGGLTLTQILAESPTAAQSVVSRQVWSDLTLMNATIQFESNNQCLDDFNYNTAAGGQVGQWQCKNGVNQKWWTTTCNGFSGYYQIRNMYSGLCLSAEKIQHGYAITQEKCGNCSMSEPQGLMPQLWTFYMTDNPVGVY